MFAEDGWPSRSPRPAAGAALALAGALLSLALATPVKASAAPPAPRSEAETLYRDAVKLVDGGEADKACPLFEQSVRLDPASSTKLALAACYEKTRRPATAWSLYKEVESDAKASGDKKREAEAAAHAAALEPKLPRIKILVPAPIAALPGLEVKRDGAVVRDFGTPVPVDLGEHKVSVGASGKRPLERKVSVEQPGETTEVTVPPLDDVISEPPPQRPEDIDLNRLLLPPPRRSGPDPARQSLIWVTGGIALVGIGLGSTFGVLAISRWDDVEKAAPGGCRDPGGYKGCAQPVRDLQVEASSFATISTFCFIAGTTALAGTALLWLTSPSSTAAQPARLQVVPIVAAGTVGGSVVGAF